MVHTRLDGLPRTLCAGKCELQHEQHPEQRQKGSNNTQAMSRIWTATCNAATKCLQQQLIQRIGFIAKSTNDRRCRMMNA